MKGSEKVLLGQERMAFNFIYTFATKEENFPYIAEIRSVRKGISEIPAIFKVLVKIDRGRPKIFCRIKTVTKDIPLAIVMRAFGITHDYEIFKSICFKMEKLDDEEKEDLKGLL